MSGSSRARFVSSSAALWIGLALGACESTESLGTVLECKNGICVDQSVVSADASLPTGTLADLEQLALLLRGSYTGVLAGSAGQVPEVVVRFEPSEQEGRKGDVLSGSMTLDCASAGCSALFPIDGEYTLTGLLSTRTALGFVRVNNAGQIDSGFDIKGAAFDPTGQQLVLALGSSAVTIFIQATRDPAP